MGLALDPGPPDADVGREHGEAFRGRDVDPLRAHVELVDPRELGVRAAHADRGRRDAALDEGPTRLATPERDVAARHLRIEQPHVEAERQALVRAQGRHGQVRRHAVGARAAERVLVRHLRHGERDADVEPRGAERLGRRLRVIAQRRADVLRQEPKVALADGLQAVDVEGRCRAGGEDERQAGKRFHRSWFHSLSCRNCSTRTSSRRSAA